MVNIYNVSGKSSFVDILAGYFIQRYKDKPEELSSILFLLPNRRACQNLADAFVRCRGGKPTILPRMEPIAEADEDEVFLGGDAEILPHLKPAIDKTERVFDFTKLIMHKNEYGVDDVSLAQAYALAQNLASLIDTVQNEELDFNRLKDIVPDDYSDHWRKTLTLLKIITEYWPQILKEKGVCDPTERRKQLLRAEMNFWRKSDGRQKIVIAGSTAAFPVLKEMIKTVAEFPQGEVYLYGLDKYIDDDSWQKIDENHPQYELKELLDYLHLTRDNIEDITECKLSLREKLISEIMRPAPTTGEWRKLSEEVFPKDTFDNIHLINCDDMRHEAKTIALIMRETLETEGKTVALVTVDRNLSRRVISELKKWKIEADDSAGQPLSLTHIGIYFRLIAEAIVQNNMTAKIALLKYPFTSCGENGLEFRKKVYELEKTLRDEKDVTENQQSLLDNFEKRLLPLKELYESPTVNLKTVLTAHIEVAQNLADTDVQTGDKIIWKNDDGHAAADFFSVLINKSEELGDILTNDYLPFLVITMTEKNVRSRYGYHPRIKILGPIEARLTNYNRVIIGEANEGIWPKLPQADMWMSRPMKTNFGMSQTERSIGVCAADFAHLLNAPEVYVTRAQKIDGTPTDKSRWWLRFETVLEAVFGSEDKQKEKYAFIYREPYSQWAKNLERCDNPNPVKAPRPCPEIKYRPRKLSASQVEILLRDPYSVYAKEILKLKPLKNLDREKEIFDFGNIVHEVLEDFNNRYNSDFYPENAAELLMKAGLQKFSEYNVGEELQAFWKPRLKDMIEMVVKREREYRASLTKVHSEVEGKMVFKGKEGDFLITAKADRVDETKDGYLNIIDYKTGKGRSDKEIIKVTAPQLPVEAMIAQKVGFKEVKKAPVAGMQYWALKGKSGKTDYEQSQEAINKIEVLLQKLIDEFDRKERPYLAKPRKSNHGQYSDYDHLSRFLEWSVREDNNGEGSENEQ
ncbi:MAG: PD-(D/E)XK nuclease family protein [Alphaproteobacteria bacterium]|nr:PD-(D/E)XK nuclease family protein [Alphaproteobacteria bacterium]